MFANKAKVSYNSNIYFQMVLVLIHASSITKLKESVEAAEAWEETVRSAVQKLEESGFQPSVARWVPPYEPGSKSLEGDDVGVTWDPYNRAVRLCTRSFDHGSCEPHMSYHQDYG